MHFLNVLSLSTTIRTKLILQFSSRTVTNVKRTIQGQNRRTVIVKLNKQKTKKKIC